MTDLATSPVPTSRPWRTIALVAACLLVWSQALAQVTNPSPPTAPAVPAFRQADKVVVITVNGVIDQISAKSIIRRIKLAEQGGADAIVFDIDSPGGIVGSGLEVTDAIKSSTIDNTVAWVNSDAISMAAVTAIACREIVTNSPAVMGDAMMIVAGPFAPLRLLSPDERTKLLPIMLAEVTDSARRRGWDEYLVQAMAIDGIELWLVEDNATGQRLAINENEYRLLFGHEPVRGKPFLVGVTGGRTLPIRTSIPDPPPGETQATDQATDQATQEAPAPAEQTPADPATPADADDPEAAPPTFADPAPFIPATPAVDDIARELATSERADLAQSNPSQRPVLTPDDRGRYTDLGYLCDGTSAIAMSHDQLMDLGFVTRVVRTDEEVKAYFGASELIRVNESWSERFVRFMTGIVVRGLLIVVMLIALFLEMMSPGMTVPGAIAALCLVLLLAPPALVGMAGWWEIVAILLGIGLLLMEIFVIPGFGVFGVLGIVALFGGLLGTFIPSGGSLADPAMQADLARGVMVLVLALVTAGIGMYLIGRNFDRIPIFDRLILGDDPEEEQSEVEIFYAASATRIGVEVGMTGTATTVLRPSGQAEIEGSLIDVVADLGFIDPGTPVRVVKVEGMRVVVGKVRTAEPTSGTQEGSA